MAVTLLATVAAGYGFRNFAFTADYKVYFGKDNAELIAFKNFESTYTNTENILFVLQPKDKNVFTPKTLEIVKQLTNKAWQIPYAIRVDSLSNYQHTEANGDDLTVDDLVENPQLLDASDLDRIRAVALAEPVLAGRLIAYDGATTGVFVTLQFPGTDHTGHLPESVNYAEQLKVELRAAYPDLTVALTGISIRSEEHTSELQSH